MYIIPNDLYEIKQFHKYNPKLKNSDWSTGLNKAGHLPGSKLDKLRNALPNSSWMWLIETVNREEHKLPPKQRREWDNALDNFEFLFSLKLNPMHAITTEDFSLYIKEKGRDYKLLQKALWQLLTAGCESLEFINWTVQSKEVDRSMFVFGDENETA